MFRLKNEELIDLIFDTYKDLWYQEEIAAFETYKSRENQIELLQKIHDRLPYCPIKNDVRNPTIVRGCDFKKALGVFLHREKNSWSY